MPTPRTFTLTLLGDVMLARLIDQLYPIHNKNPVESRIVSTFIKEYPHLAKGTYTPSSPWGSTLPLLQTSDLTLINLETAATTTNDPWPDKTFNYRMHPANLAPILHAAGVDYASLANNHTLDFGSEGLVETVWALRDAGVLFAGAGERRDEAYKPAVLSLPRKRGSRGTRQLEEESVEVGNAHRVHVYSAADHPREWGVVPTFHLIDYSPATRVRLRTLLLSGGRRTSTGSHTDVEAGVESDVFHHREHHHHYQHQHDHEYERSRGSASTQPRPALKIFSVHWGPNYSWHPEGRIRSLAHFLIDECEVDIVHGHSSHHLQGVERYHGKVIIYGCGDFVDDYALHEGYRNDLGAVWRVVVSEREDGGDSGGDNGRPLRLDRLEIFPTRIEKFRAMLLDKEDEDHEWVRRRIETLSRELDTGVRQELGEEGQIVVDLDG